MPLGHTRMYRPHLHFCVDECFSSDVKYYCAVCAGCLSDDNIQGYSK